MFRALASAATTGPVPPDRSGLIADAVLVVDAFAERAAHANRCAARTSTRKEVMRVLSLVWVGTRTTEYMATLAFFKDVLGLTVHSSEPDFAVLDVPGGATVEVFGPTSKYNAHLTHPVAGFQVDNLMNAVDDLQAAGAELVLPPQGGETRSWLHFRAPDGFVYELVEQNTA